MAFNSREYEWADISIRLGNRDLTGIRAIKYETETEAEHLHAKGRNPHSIQLGLNKPKGEIAVLQSELHSLEDAANGGELSRLRGLIITVSYGNPSEGTPMRTDRISGVIITGDSKEMKTGDKFMEVKLPFLATLVEKNV